MNLNAWLDADRGRVAFVADHFGITSGAVSQWKTDGVPVGRMRAIAQLTEGAVSVEEMLKFRDERKPAAAEESGGGTA